MSAVALGDPYVKQWPERNPRWQVSVRLDYVDGRPECVSVHVDALGDPDDEDDDVRPVTATVMRRLPIGQIVAKARKAKAEELRRKAVWRQLGGMRRADRFPSEYMYATAAMLNAANDLEEDTAGSKPKGGRPSLGQATYLRVAEVYSEALAAGENPTRAVADEFNISEQAAASRVRRARHEYHFLPETIRGRPSGLSADDLDTEEP